MEPDRVKQRPGVRLSLFFARLRIGAGLPQLASFGPNFQGVGSPEGSPPSAKGKASPAWIRWVATAPAG